MLKLFTPATIVLIFFTIFSSNAQSKYPEIIGTETKNIDLRIAKKNKIYLNNQLTPIDSVGVKIFKLTVNFSESDRANYIVNLIVENEVKIGILSDVKRHLRQVNATRINYKSRDPISGDL